MSGEFDIDKFDDYLSEAHTSADATRPAPPEPEPVAIPEPVVVKREKSEPKGELYTFEAKDKGVQDTQYNNSMEENFDVKFRADVGASIKRALKERMDRQRHIKQLQVKLGFER